MTSSLTDDERLRTRIHQLADDVQALKIHHVEHKGVLEGHARSIERLEDSCVSRDQLESVVKMMSAGMASIQSEASAKLVGLQRETNLSLEALRSDIAPIKAGINRLAWIIVIAVVGAVLAMVVNGPPPKLIP
jgi:hypothetical protein